MKYGAHILIVGADENDVGVISFVLSNMRRNQASCCYHPFTASTAAEALAIVNNVPLDLVLLLEPMKWIQDVIDSLRQNTQLTNSIVVLNSRNNMDVYVCDRCLYRPTMEELIATITVLLVRRRGPRKGSKRLPKSQPIVLEEAVTA